MIAAFVQHPCECFSIGSVVWGTWMMGWHGPGPWDPLREIQREFGRILLTFDSLSGGRSVRPYPAINVDETADAYYLTAEVPGMEPGSVEVALTGEKLSLRGERRRPDSVREEQYRRQERTFGRWSRSVTLPERVDGEQVTACCAHGILTVVLPKADDARPRQIAVTGGKD